MTTEACNDDSTSTGSMYNLREVAQTLKPADAQGLIAAADDLDYLHPRVEQLEQEVEQRRLVALIDTAVRALKRIAESPHECSLSDPAEVNLARKEPCRTCTANEARLRIAQEIEEVPF